jgi:dihydroflavonol-4-reductase
MLAEHYGAASVRLLAFPGEQLPDEKPWRELAVYTGDVRSPRSLIAAVSGCEAVVNLAGFLSHRQRDRGQLFAVNCQGAANVAAACIAARVRRLVHVSSIGAVGFRPDREPVDESAPYNWPDSFHYMASKYRGQETVRQLAAEHGLELTVLNPASIMGPGDRIPSSGQNQVFALVLANRLLPTFTGANGVVDVRDVAEIAIRAIKESPQSQPCLLVGANIEYSAVLRAIAASFNRSVRLVPMPSALIAASGLLLETLPLNRNRLSFSYGRMSGWHCYYDASLSTKVFGHAYRDFNQTIADGCRYFLEHIGRA